VTPELEATLKRLPDRPGVYLLKDASGDVLYVVEHLDGQTGRYQVRAVDVATGKLRDQVIADKRNLDEAMAGWPIAQLRRSDGVVLTLYRGLEHPFDGQARTPQAGAQIVPHVQIVIDQQHGQRHGSERSGVEGVGADAGPRDRGGHGAQGRDRPVPDPSKRVTGYCTAVI